MPVRITCPACSATLSIRDEFAGRAVKCPKCAGLIPPQPLAPPTISDAESVATVPPPAPPPEPEPQPEVAAKAESETPAARAKDDRGDDDDRPRKKRRDEEDDEEDRPRKKKREDEEDEDRPRKKREDEQGEDDRPRKKREEDEEDQPRKRRDDDDDDRPRKKRREEDDRDEDDDRPRRRRRDEDEDDDRPRKKRRRDDDDDDRPVVRPSYTPRGSNVGIIFAAGALLLGFAAVGGGIYAYNQNEKANRETEAANAAAKDKANAASAFITNFERVKIGDARGRADEALGSGKLATADDLGKVFKNTSDTKKIVDWGAKVSEGRVLLWQNEESFALVALHPDANGRVMAKALRAKNGSSIDAGDLNDASFLRRFPPKGETPPKGKQPQPGD